MKIATMIIAVVALISFASIANAEDPASFGGVWAFTEKVTDSDCKSFPNGMGGGTLMVLEISPKGEVSGYAVGVTRFTEYSGKVDANGEIDITAKQGDDKSTLKGKFSGGEFTGTRKVKTSKPCLAEITAHGKKL
ncbi:MAG: hypothetical protein FJ088_11215 [Deltaproteobacteria bacterium]|nr:hypothetical protein [Deltaproteobacteria bacterium]